MNTVQCWGGGERSCYCFSRDIDGIQVNLVIDIQLLFFKDIYNTAQYQSQNLESFSHLKDHNQQTGQIMSSHGL